jgi:carboxypeptidase T
MDEDKFVTGTHYRTLDCIYEDMRSILSSTPFESESVQLGRSARDNPITAVCLGDGDFTKPELLYFSGMHAMEFIGPAMNLALLEYVASREKDSPIGRALERVNVWFLPVFNPDGYLAVTRQLTSRLGLAYSRANANGVDLNRNFPVAFYENATNFFAGSPLRLSPYYRGPEPCSEPESRVFRDFILGRNFKISMDFHCFGNLIGYPYGYSDRECRDRDVFRRIGRDMIARQPRRKYRLIPMHRLYRVSGDIDDWLYDECRILSFIMEIGALGFNIADRRTVLNPFFWANPENPDQLIADNLDACLHLIDALLDLEK